LQKVIESLKNKLRHHAKSPKLEKYFWNVMLIKKFLQKKFQKERVHPKINNQILFCFLNLGELSRSHGKSIEIGENE
jgi:hypothetical protein